jgi:hypothetical protein
MEPQSTLDHSSAASDVEANIPATGVKPQRLPAPRSSPASVSARIAAAGLLEHPPSGRASLDPTKEPRFPGEDGGRSLAQMADGDLDAALQLLADRAQYITGASGAAIALRRGEHSDMLCRASAGTSAPELGAILSMEYGLSGESVRTGRALRCDDAETDPRVNREVCRQLGIASVVVMPIVSERQVLGVFELFSGKPDAFDERDLAALQRLSEMVETAVQHAVAAQAPLPPVESAVPRSIPSQAAIQSRNTAVKTQTPENKTQAAPISPPGSPSKLVPSKLVPSPLASSSAEIEDASGRPLLWSAAMRTKRSTRAADDKQPEASEPMIVPPVLKKLQKCEACGFPVSLGRAYCVECEEKSWRGEQLPQSRDQMSEIPLGDSLPASQVTQETLASPKQSLSIHSISIQMSSHAPEPVADELTQKIVGSASEAIPTRSTTEPTAETPLSEIPAPFLASAVSSESWFSAHKYILAVLLVVAIVVGATAYFH